MIMHTEGRSQHIHDDHHHDVIGDEKEEKENQRDAMIFTQVSNYVRLSAAVSRLLVPPNHLFSAVRGFKSSLKYGFTGGWKNP